MEINLEKIVSTPQKQRDASERRLTPGEKKLLNFMGGEILSQLRKEGLTTKSNGFEERKKQLVNETLNKHGIRAERGDFTRDYYWGQLAARAESARTPEAVAAYELKQKMKGKKYLPLEKETLVRIIADALERACISAENMDFESEEEKDKRKIRKNITDALISALYKYQIKPEEHQKYIKDLRPIILKAIKRKTENPTENILKELYQR